PPRPWSRVSISDEMPGPWRPRTSSRCLQPFRRFNLRRDARPLATLCRLLWRCPWGCFNLRRDARPLATPPPRRLLPLLSLQWHFSPGAFSREFSPKRHDGEQRADDPLFPRGLFPGIFLGTANTSCPSRADVTRYKHQNLSCALS